MKKFLWSLAIVFVGMVTSSNAVFAQYDFRDGCESLGQCIDNRKCVVVETIIDMDVRTDIVGLSTEPNCNASEIGGVKAPPGVARFDRSIINNGGNAGTQNIGIILFISNLLKVFAIIAGIWAMFNLIMGGYVFITSAGDAGATEKVRTSITMTVIGLAIIAGGYIIAALVGALMFGDPNFILQPQLQGALQ
ncbi:MAG: hypothetical protein QG639_225 [Patescibacteria group bacterium]|nr:hypothetical protein [Patescibacteria group bacterium]